MFEMCMGVRVKVVVSPCVLMRQCHSDIPVLFCCSDDQLPIMYTPPTHVHVHTHTHTHTHTPLHMQNGWTALMWSARFGQRAVAELLIENGAKVEHQDEVMCVFLCM